MEKRLVAPLLALALSCGGSHSEGARADVILAALSGKIADFRNRCTAIIKEGSKDRLSHNFYRDNPGSTHDVCNCLDRSSGNGEISGVCYIENTKFGESKGSFDAIKDLVAINPYNGPLAGSDDKIACAQRQENSETLSFPVPVGATIGVVMSAGDKTAKAYILDGGIDCNSIVTNNLKGNLSIEFFDITVEAAEKALNGVREAAVWFRGQEQQ